MARGLNKVLIIGNLGGEPEIKYTASGTAIANLRVATAESRKNKEGEWEEYTEWHRVVMFGRLAEICKDYLKKGSKIFLEGRLQTRSWEDQSGQKHYMTEIVGANLLMLDSKGQTESVDFPESQSAPSDSPGNIPKPPTGDEKEDDLPF